MEGSSEEPKVAIKVENFSFAYGTGEHSFFFFSSCPMLTAAFSGGANGLTDASVLKEVNFEIEHGEYYGFLVIIRRRSRPAGHGSA